MGFGSLGFLGAGIPVPNKLSRLRARLLFACIMLCLVADATAANIDVEVQDTAPFHVFLPGQPFSFDISVMVTSGTAPNGLGFQWRDYRGNPLGPVIPISDGVRTTVTSPTDTPVTGYYGLAFLPDDPDVTFNEISGSRKEIGFVVLPPKSISARTLNQDSPFGIVHADLDDPYLSTWIKTLTWNTAGAVAWTSKINRRRNIGFQELPLVSGDGWVSDDTAAVSVDFIGALKAKIRSYFEADPLTEYWELGLEENLSSRFDEPVYFANLQAKAAAVREVANGVNLRFLYQVAGSSLSDANAFFASEAAQEFDIFAPHPYAWPDFPAPEEWLEAFIDDRRIAMQQHGIELPMWFTEIGAPQNDAEVPQMLSGNSPVRGQSRDENAAYLVKSHVIALAQGIEKILWYNYVDRGPSTTDVEDHFGLIDFWKFPKPSYVAYVTMVKQLEGKRFQERRDLPGGVRIYEFSDTNQRCFIAWTNPASVQTVPLSLIRAGLNENNIVAVANTVGTPLPISADVLVEEFPVFITISTDTEAPSVPVNVVATADSSSQINLSWSASIDDSAVAGYRIRRDNTEIATTTGARFNDTGLDAMISYAYTVNAFDETGNESVESSAAIATTLVDSGSSSGSGAIDIVFTTSLLVLILLKSGGGPWRSTPRTGSMRLDLMCIANTPRPMQSDVSQSSDCDS